MSTFNVKKIEVGKLSIDLPSSYCIHELPLFEFVDVHQSFEVSLIFNFGLMKENVNTFLIKPGYKFNFQKRIIIEGSNYSIQDASGKIEDASYVVNKGLYYIGKHTDDAVSIGQTILKGILI